MLFHSLRSASWKGFRISYGRVYLQPSRNRDWREWAELRAESRDFLTPWEPTWSFDSLTRGAYRQRVRQSAQDWREGASFGFLIFRAEGHILLGGLTLTNVRRGVAQTASLGYWIGERYARQGFMTEALGAALEFAFDQLTLHRVEAACLPNNDASRGLLEKVGFSREGHARGYLRINGVWQDHLLYAILRDDWKVRKMRRKEASLQV